MTDSVWPPLVELDDARDGRCLHCWQQVDRPHRAVCPRWRRPVHLRAHVQGLPPLDYTEQVPFSQTRDSVLFRFNEGTWCAGNLYDHPHLRDALEKRFGVDSDGDTPCLCGIVRVEFVAEGAHDQ